MTNWSIRFGARINMVARPFMVINGLAPPDGKTYMNMTPTGLNVSMESQYSTSSLSPLSKTLRSHLVLNKGKPCQRIWAHHAKGYGPTIDYQGYEPMTNMSINEDDRHMI